MKNKLLMITGFLVFGAAAGLLSAWYDGRYDIPLYLDFPGYFLGMVMQIKVLPSVIAWGIIGTVLALLLKPKITAWIMAAYVIVFGVLTLAASLI